MNRRNGWFSDICEEEFTNREVVVGHVGLLAGLVFIIVAGNLLT